MAVNQKALNRLNSQIAWYNKKSGHNKRMFHFFKLVEILLAASIPVIAKYNIALVLSIIGAVIVVLESIQGLFKLHENWILYRSTAESLKHEKNLYELSAGPYADDLNPDKTLAERTEGLVSQEHAKWTTSRSEHNK